MKMTSDFDFFTINPEDSAFEALSKIEVNGYGTVIVVTDKNGQLHVVGTLSDGDIRKALLDHHMLTIPVKNVMNQAFLSVFEGELDRAKSFFSKSFFIRLIPVVTSEGILIDVIKRS